MTRLSLLIPTFNNASTVERTLTSALSQTYRPLEVVAYDEASSDGTREIIDRVMAAAPAGVETRALTSEQNSGPLPAWRRLLHEASGEWSAFVWSDDVLMPTYAAEMMAAAERADEAGRVLVACSAEVESEGRSTPYYSVDQGVVTAVDYSEAMFRRRLPLTQICAIYRTTEARAAFERHVDIDNPRGFDYQRHPYGNDVGFLSDLAMVGGGVELLGRRLVTLVDSQSSMTRRGTHQHLWQMRWQYTYSFLRVWRWWRDAQVPGAARLTKAAERRLALCSLMLDLPMTTPSEALHAISAYLDFRELDYQRRHLTLDQHRSLVLSRTPFPGRIR